MEQDTAGPSDPVGPAGLPDTAMMSGSDDGEPGERLADPPLSDDDRAVLDALATHDAPVVEAVEDSGAASTAAEDDSPLPGVAASRGPDPLDPVFREPPPD